MAKTIRNAAEAKAKADANTGPRLNHAICRILEQVDAVADKAGYRLIMSKEHKSVPQDALDAALVKLGFKTVRNDLTGYVVGLSWNG